MYPTTKAQKLWRVNGNGQLKAEIDVCLTNEHSDSERGIQTPSLESCRHAVLQINNSDKGYVVYDRLLCRIVNGVYYTLDLALASAQDYNDNPESPQDMAPNGLALGLIYPAKG